MVEQQAVRIILGGTFDPIHFGHLRMAQEMLNLFPDAEIALMPAAYPPHREQPGAKPEQRIEMLQLALQDSSQLTIDSRELEREEPSYSVVTLNDIRQTNPTRSLIFLMGSDAFAKLDQWYQWQNILELTNILVIERPQSEMPTTGPVADLLEQHKVESGTELANYANGKIAFYKMPLLDISSSHIREQIKCGKSPRFLLPNAILDYIIRNQLYRR